MREKKLAKLSHKERIVLCMPILALHLLLHYNLTVLCPIGMLPDFAQARARALRGLSLHAMEAHWLGHPIALVDPGLKVGVTRNLLCKMPERLSLSLGLSFT